jgi:hypothetical protein
MKQASEPKECAGATESHVATMPEKLAMSQKERKKFVHVYEHKKEPFEIKMKNMIPA